MQGPAILGAAAVLAAGVAFATVHFTAAPAPAAPAQDAEITLLREQLEALRKQVGGMQAAAAAPAELPRIAAPEFTDAQVEQALARYLAANGGKLPVPATAGGSEGVDVGAVFAQLRGDSDFWSHGDLYKKMHAAGRMAELIEAFELAAKQNPNDPQAQMDLGNAYLAALQLDQTKWQLSMEADKVFDRVLTLDENHWEARFTKAMSYTFWPDFLGKKKEAIAHFERLVEQQEKMPAHSGFAETYLFLGNLLEQRGESDRARQIWQRGARLHPDHHELRQKIGN